jgi:hypothetical protein
MIKAKPVAQTASNMKHNDENDSVVKATPIVDKKIEVYRDHHLMKEKSPQPVKSSVKSDLELVSH